MRANHFFFSLHNLAISPFLIVNKRVGCGREYDCYDKEGLEQTHDIILCVQIWNQTVTNIFSGFTWIAINVESYERESSFHNTDHVQFQQVNILEQNTEKNLIFTDSFSGIKLDVYPSCIKLENAWLATEVIRFLSKLLMEIP